MRPQLLLTLLSVLLVSLAAAGAVAYAQLLPASQPSPTAHLTGAVSWNSLNQEQKTALQPLANLWPTLSGEHQRKWIALAHNFNRMSPTEQATLQGRMTEWAKLTPAQRTQARLNFGETRKLPIDDKKAKWEEYQSLTPEQRQRLAADRPKPPKSTAPALRPVSPEKILRTPPASQQAGTPKAPLPVNRNTLLPRPPVSAASSAAR